MMSLVFVSTYARFHLLPHSYIAVGFIGRSQFFTKSKSISTLAVGKLETRPEQINDCSEKVVLLFEFLQEKGTLIKTFLKRKRGENIGGSEGLAQLNNVVKNSSEVINW